MQYHLQVPAAIAKEEAHVESRTHETPFAPTVVLGVQV